MDILRHLYLLYHIGYLLAPRVVMLAMEQIRRALFVGRELSVRTTLVETVGRRGVDRPEATLCHSAIPLAHPAAFAALWTAIGPLTRSAL